MMRSKTIRFANGLNSKFEAVLLHFQNLHLHQGGILLLNDFLQHGHTTVGHLEEVGQSKGEPVTCKAGALQAYEAYTVIFQKAYAESCGNAIDNRLQSIHS